jgi:hypothetical protein
MRNLIAVLILAAVACSESPTPVEPVPAPAPPIALAPPSSCNAFAPLSATLGDLTGDAITSDGGGAYAEGQSGVEVHVNGPTGNLSIWTTESPRYLVANTTLTGGAPVTVNIDRAYTNTHSNACGLRLSTLPANSTAVFEAEERAGGTGHTVSKAQYGKACASGSPTGSRVNILRVNATTIQISGSSGVYCTKNNKNKFVHAGTTGPFVMTLTAQ